MPRISAKFDVLELDKKAWTVKIKEYTERQLKEAAKIFAQTAIALIPVRTGFVAGAMSNIAEMAGISYSIEPQGFFTRPMRVRLGASPSVSRFDVRRDFKKTEYYYPPSGAGRILKTPLSGKRYATKPESIIKSTDTKITFEYQVDISYFNISDVQKSRSPTSPWQSFDKGMEAMMKYLETTGTKTLPKLTDFITKHEVRTLLD